LRRHQFARAESLSKRVLAFETGSVAGHANLVQAQVSLGKLDAAAATIAHFDSVSPGSPRAAMARARLLHARGTHDSATVVLRRVMDGSTDVVLRQTVAGMLRDLALVRGDIPDGRRWVQVWTDAALQRNVPAAALAGALDQAWITFWFDHDTSAAFREVASALERHPLDTVPPLDRPYGKLIRLFAWAGRPARARIALAGYDSATGAHPRRNARALASRYRGEIALAERRYDDAIASFRAADSTSCATCVLPLLAITYDRVGARDSARVSWRRYVEIPEYDRFETDASFLRLALGYGTNGIGVTPTIAASRR
jgi:tetratricopeptide (TPR) repeat protein